MLSDPEVLANRAGGNLVVVASNSLVDLTALILRIADRGTGWDQLSGTALRAWIGNATVLTDNYAPVDQLLTPYGN